MIIITITTGFLFFFNIMIIMVVGAAVWDIETFGMVIARSRGGITSRSPAPWRQQPKMSNIASDDNAQVDQIL